MASVFLSYRRADTELLIGRIVDRLEAARFTVFYDVDTISPGDKWKDSTRKHIEECKVLIAVIGKAWMSQRLTVVDDPVRMEIASALKLNKPVIPLLVNGCPFPSAENLPNDIKAIQTFNAADLDSARDFHIHMDRLINTIIRLIGIQPVEHPSDRALSPRTAALGERALEIDFRRPLRKLLDDLDSHDPSFRKPAKSGTPQFLKNLRRFLSEQQYNAVIIPLLDKFHRRKRLSPREADVLATIGLDCYQMKWRDFLQLNRLVFLTKRVDAAVGLRVCENLFGLKEDHSYFFSIYYGQEIEDFLGELIFEKLIDVHFSDLTNETFFAISQSGEELIRATSG